MKTKHTPLPWTTEESIYEARIVSLNDEADNSLICSIPMKCSDREETIANINFVVNAVNPHTELVEVLTYVYKYLSHDFSDGRKIEIRDLLEKATRGVIP